MAVAQPGDARLDRIFRKMAFMTAAGPNVNPSEEREEGGGATPVNKVISDENPVRLRIVSYGIGAMVARALAPLAVRVSAVHVVAAGRTVIRAFFAKTGIAPVFGVRQGFGHPHRIDEAGLRAYRFRDSSENPVVRTGGFTDFGLARSQRAEAVKRIGREATVMHHYVRI